MGCLQWISAHTWVMLIRVISFPTNWAHTCNTLYIACLLVLDSLGLYIWITIGRYTHLFNSYYTVMEEIWDLLVFVLITAWDITEVFHNASISKPDIAMFNRGIVPLPSACAFTLNFKDYHSFFYVHRWHPFNLGITMMHNMLRCITYSWFSCRYG